ncbi:Desiccation-related protein PCC13-62 Flags:Precursor [Monoraphidium neglectum]|uniref:Uncharacterized protein n=1 Tax=Monoraphidium neglectum TaxID=145388 RepID=A0A0D2LGG1_9CHLO|nr:Desiccation-related protein PCC13-62 Flags:Precursor [Monoraphidium neglectum]KIZ05609.1 Desiccation-related protein PCC13-62 Flags:Precursor [Monoraphidium neglectum]|eukprot:XP_013904628.1 Desiccation-related protein PCC13-62 Flags:Precursor [Monoraphidium neglectum]
MNYTQAIYNWSDTDLLQFKINGECLEANFDACAAFGRPLAPKLRSPGRDPPVPIGCRKANLTNPTVIQWAQELSHSEAGHMRILREALYDAGVEPITCPPVDYANGFTEFYNNALKRTGKDRVKWDPFKDDLHFLISAETMETAGVVADLGLALFFRDPLYVAVLGGLTGGAAQFTAIDRTLIWPHINDTLEEFDMTVKDFMDAVSSYRDALDGPVSIDQSYIFAGGCFFPEGMAGPINTTQPLLIPTIPKSLIAANNEPVAVTFEPWGADPFKHDTPAYTKGYTKLRPAGEPYVAKEPASCPEPYQFPAPGERTTPKVNNPKGAVANKPFVPTGPGLLPPGALAGDKGTCANQ